MRAFTALACVLLALPVHATDVDGPNDCNRELRDFGDAPEGIPAYPGVAGHFPTCITATPAGTQTSACPPISTPPGLTGFVSHVQFGPNGPGNYWLGCYLSALGPLGIDTEADGKTNTPAIGTSACHGGPTDCIEAAPWGMTFDQDECYADGSDACLTTAPSLHACGTSVIDFKTYNCGPTRQVYLNILVDMNVDGDWNDNFRCPPGSCAYEWANKNVPIALPSGCGSITSMPFLVGPMPGPTWIRISLTDDPMPDDFPWNGTVSLGGQARGGETEDYPAFIDQHVGVRDLDWGNVKTLYR